MHRPAPGRYVTVTTAGELFQAFVPAPLPPEPPVVWSAALRSRLLQRQPIATSAALVKVTKLTPATVNKSLAHLERIGIVAELTNRQRGRVFSYRQYVDELAAELQTAG